MKKNITLIFFSLIFVFFLIYLLVFTWVAILEKYQDKNNFTNIENLNFHEKFSDKMHHLRGKWPEYKKNLTWDKEDYLFTVFTPFKKDSKNYLIQGDSWAEYMVFKDSINKTLSDIVKEKKIGLINAGIASFSPSPMKVQYEILEKEYGIKPNYLIAIIDQTDLGDELCRYKHNITENKDGTVKFIKREFNTGALMDYSKFYAFSKIILQKENFVNFHITNYYFYKSYHQTKAKITNLIKYGFKNRGNYKCEFQQIQKYFYNLNEKDRAYFEKRILQYLNYLETKIYLKKIFIVTFPHENHLLGNYNVNISDIINDLNLPSKITHIDFNKIIKNENFQKNNIFEENDPASHLNKKFHSLFLKKIFEIIN